MAFHYVPTCFKCVIRIEYSFLSQQSAMSVRKRAAFLSLNRISGLGQRVTKQGPRATAALRTRGVLKTSQGCHTCNRTDQRPEVTCPAVRFLQLLLMRSGPGQLAQTPSTSQWIRPSGPHRSVVHAFREGPRGQKGNEAPHIQ